MHMQWKGRAAAVGQLYPYGVGWQNENLKRCQSVILADGIGGGSR